MAATPSRIIRPVRPFILILLTLSIGACAAPRHLSPDFGNSFNAGMSRQVVNPGAPTDPSRVAAFPGELAGKLYEKKYVKMMTEDRDEEERGIKDKLE